MNFKLYCATLLALLFIAGSALSQQTGAPGRAKSSPSPSSSDGQVIFSRGDTGSSSTGNNAGHSGIRPGNQQTAPSPTAPPTPSGNALVTNAQRTALTYSSYDFEVHLEPPQHSIAVQAKMTAQNSSGKPLGRIALQLSSSLHWYSIQVDGRPVKFQTETIESDIDHTGQLTEAVVTLAKPLAPAGTVRINVLYSGKIEKSAVRLLRLDAPAKIADASEWDEIGTDFTGLRGFGNVIWFPVSTAPVLFGQGAEMFDSVGKWKLQESNARIAMHVLVEYLNVKPTIAFLNGYVVQPDGEPSGPAAATQGPVPSVPPATTAGNTVLQVESFTLRSTPLGFSPLSLFVMYAAHEGIPGLDIYSRAGNEAAVSIYESVFQQTRPLVEQWLGRHPSRPVVLVDLPEVGDLPFEERNLLFLPLKADATGDDVGPVMAHMLGHSYFRSPRPWLNEGVSQFMTLLWIEQRAGLATAIAQMDSRRAALALAEISDPGVDPGQSLIDAWSDIYYRDKAVDVLWMLRNIVGDEPLARALQAYHPADDREPGYLQVLLHKTSAQDLEWFFDDWVYRDRGLPDLHIVSAYWRPILSKNTTGRNYLVSVDVRNDSFCSAEVPVTVESTSSNQTKELLVPSHSSAAMRVLTDSKPAQVIVNNGSVPEVESSHHEQAVLPAE